MFWILSAECLLIVSQTPVSIYKVRVRGNHDLSLSRNVCVAIMENHVLKDNFISASDLISSWVQGLAEVFVLTKTKATWATSESFLVPRVWNKGQDTSQSQKFISASELVNEDI